MATTQAGGCRCAAIRYQLNADPFLVAHCHCRDCQYSTGGGSATVMILPRAGFEITQGETASYTVDAESGSTVTRHFCGDCGSPLFSQLGANPEIFALKPGSLDDSASVAPMAHIWTVSAPAWSLPEDGLPRFERNPQQ